MTNAAARLDTADALSAALELFRRGDFRGSAARADEVLAVSPDNPDALHLRGMTAKCLRDFGLAEACLRKAIRHGDNHPGAFHLHANLGTILADQGRLAEAEAEFDIATRRAPAEADPLNSWGNALRVAGRFSEAERLLRKAHEAAPRRADILNNLAAAIQQQGRLNDAADMYHRVLELDPNLAVAHYNLGCIYGEALQLEMAVAHHERALALAPDYMDTMTIRLRLAQMMCDWPAVARYAPRLKELADRFDQPIFPFALLGLPTDSAELQKCARRWVAKYYRPYADLAASFPPHAPEPGNRRIRVGYLSSDFHNHATAYLMAEVFELHDRKRFEIIAYSAGPDDGKEMRQRLMKGFDRFVDIRNMSHDAAAALIRNDGIDILVDLKGYTKDTRSAVLAFRPAPIQVNYLGYPGTMGAPFVDYIIADEFILPPAHAHLYDEQPAWLPDCYQANDRQRAIAARPSRKECGLPEDAVVLCCFNHTYKISETMFATWCRLLHEVPGTVLWLLKSNRWAEDNLRRFAAERGIDASRLVFAPEKPLDQHLARLQNADFFLDTLPYNAHTTCSDALWAGVPVVTCIGETFASRVAGSLLRTIGLEELVTQSIDDYFALARSLATDAAKLKALRERLAAFRTGAPLFDTPRFTRHLEQLYESMWQRHMHHLPPAPLRVPPVPANSTSPGTPMDMPANAQTSELLIGCGQVLIKKVFLEGRREWGKLTTLDINADHKPDVVWDLTKLPLPFEDNSFDEIHAYEVLEHTGAQGDYKFFFAQFTDFWRILKPGGLLIGTCPLPTSVWAWGDPSHTRIVQKEQFVFLDQTQYTAQVGRSAMSDFRYLYKADFAPVHLVEKDDLLQFILKAVKPSRISI